MTEGPADQPLDLTALRQDDELITAASKGQVTDPDVVAALLRDWAAMCQEGTPDPRKEI